MWFPFTELKIALEMAKMLITGPICSIRARGRCGIPSDIAIFDLRFGFYGSKTL